ncbi:uncharacterized protein OCT59_012946 [Rhizophagus irregularis]|uniref:uncharacterized protein n=1 Tax=Rhizophagus irregularis TaxID=588596 RepID=UPI0033267797|nr:hypothetical protein OCT59_012946 [Rhizophagus irregularis]
MGPIVRTFSYNDSIIVSKALNADNKENGENKLQDEMDVESDNDDNNGEDDNGNGEKENNEDDDDDNNEEDDDDIYGEENVYYDDDVDNVDENEMEEDYNLGVDDSIIDDTSSNHKDTIVDSSLDNDYMSKINGSFAPYFENATSILLFCWIQKHNISTNAYNDLVEILQHQKFEVKDIAKNIRRFQIYRPSEFAIYKENGNQRFGQIRSIVSVNDELQIKIQQIYTYDELPNNFHCHSRMNTRESQLWLVDQYLEESSIIASTNEIVRKIDITIVRDSTIITDGLFIKTILYKNNGHWKLRDATLDYMHPCEYSVIAGLGCVTADLPQGNDLTGVKRHGAIKGCRTCLTAKENATDITLDIANISRYHHITNTQFEDIFTALTQKERSDLAKEYGLHTILPILDQLQREHHLQSPQDIYHLIAGKTSKLLKLMISILSPEGERRFIREWKSFKYPRQWLKLPNPISHLESFMMSDHLRLGMVMPFILNRFLVSNCLKPQEMEKLQVRTNLNRNQVINAIVKCWAIVAKCSRLAFKNSLTNNDYIVLEKYLKMEQKALIELFDDFVGLPNLHANCHLLRHARTFGTLTNTEVGTKEMVHHWFIMKNSEMDDEELLEVCSQSSQFRNIMLRKPISGRNTNIVIDTTFQIDLSLVYESFGYHTSMINKTFSFYKYASYINKVRKVHFVHDCNARCKDSHDSENKHYLKNDFFFEAI